MKTKHYIYIAIGLLLTIIISIPAYYYYKGYIITNNASKDKCSQYPIYDTTFSKNNCNIIEFITAYYTTYYLSKFKKYTSWTLEEPNTNYQS